MLCIKVVRMPLPYDACIHAARLMYLHVFGVVTVHACMSAVRGVAYAVRAATVANSRSTIGEATVYVFLVRTRRGQQGNVMHVPYVYRMS